MIDRKSLFDIDWHCLEDNRMWFAHWRHQASINSNQWPGYGICLTPTMHILLIYLWSETNRIWRRKSFNPPARESTTRKKNRRLQLYLDRWLRASTRIWKKIYFFHLISPHSLSLPWKVETFRSSNQHFITIRRCYRRLLTIDLNEIEKLAKLAMFANLYFCSRPVLLIESCVHVSTPEWSIQSNSVAFVSYTSLWWKSRCRKWLLSRY